mgnify:CR=1 FL=1
MEFWQNLGGYSLIRYRNCNLPQIYQTGSPEKYPQGFFNEKPCKKCGEFFNPRAPSHLYCSQKCADHAHSDKLLYRQYGILYDTYLYMHSNQEGNCAICGGKGFDMKNTSLPRLVVDHDHKSGKVRELLCHNCNRALGLLQDSCKIVENALNYLRKHK